MAPSDCTTLFSQTVLGGTSFFWVVMCTSYEQEIFLILMADADKIIFFPPFSLNGVKEKQKSDRVIFIIIIP